MTEQKKRPGFGEWLRRFRDPSWKDLPLTHVTKTLTAEDIMRDEKIIPKLCEHFKEPVSYFFYGRPAYRVAGDGTIRAEAACPTCFVLKPELIKSAKRIFAFDTGAFFNRLYTKILMDEMKVEDFSLEISEETPNRLISATFGSLQNYLDGVPNVSAGSPAAEPYDFHANAYLNLLTSEGRNEPDDRIHSIEVQLGSEVKLVGNVLAIVVPHTLWSSPKPAPWLSKMHDAGISILPYKFLPGRNPDYYYNQMESLLREKYVEWGYLA